jgi:hypothetical protein
MSEPTTTTETTEITEARERVAQAAEWFAVAARCATGSAHQAVFLAEAKKACSLEDALLVASADRA